MLYQRVWQDSCYQQMEGPFLLLKYQQWSCFFTTQIILWGTPKIADGTFGQQVPNLIMLLQNFRFWCSEAHRNCQGLFIGIAMLSIHQILYLRSLLLQCMKMHISSWEDVWITVFVELWVAVWSITWYSLGIVLQQPCSTKQLMKMSAPVYKLPHFPLHLPWVWHFYSLF